MVLLSDNGTSWSIVTRNCFWRIEQKYSDDDDDDYLGFDYLQVSSMKPAEAVAAWKGMVEKA